MNQPRLCMLAPEFLPVLGGTGSYTVELLKSLPQNMDIHVVTLKRQMGSRGDSLSNIKAVFKRTLKVYYVSTSRDTFFYNVPFQLGCFVKVPLLHKKYHFDVLHSHMCQMPDLFLKLFNQLNLPTVVTIHGTIQMLRDHAVIARNLFKELESGEKSILRFYPITKGFQQLYVKKVDIFIAVSKITKEMAIEHLGFKNCPEKINVVYNGVDTTLFNVPNKNELSKRYLEPTIVYVGRIISKKGIDVLVKAMPGVLREFPKARFLFIGGGDISFYKELIRSMGIDQRNFSFTGQLGYFERSRIYREATVFVNPSFFENCSISILEAMSSGCAVIASNVGGNPELIRSSENGLLVRPFDHFAFSNSIVSLLRDESENRRLGRLARLTVEKSFSLEKCGAETQKVYASLLNSK